MRRPLLLALGLVLAITPLAGAAPLSAVTDSPTVVDLGADVITTDNVTYHGTIPLDSPGVGGEVVVREDLGKTFFYATGAKGLSIYDVSDPASPAHVGFLAFNHAQNEDLKVSEDGTRAVIAADGSILVPVAPASPGIHVIDTTDPSNPQIIGSSSPLVRGEGVDRGIAEHTAECADADCTWIYGRTGRIYDATNLPVITEVGRWNVDRNGNDVGGIHALNRDESGLLISDSHPRLILDTVGVVDPSATPAEPVVLAQGERSRQDNRLQHNNVRTDPEGWSSRDPEDPADAIETAVASVDFEVNERAISAANERPVMRDGELMLGNSETNLNNNCNAAGGLSTWSIVDFDKGAPMTQLEVFRPLNGTWADGSPAANALGCSGHWFTESDGFVAASWYEHGVRFFDVDKTVGTITEIGFFQPITTQAGAAYWVDDEFVYSVDYARGIDIISFDRGEDARASQAELDLNWMQSMNRIGTLATVERSFCSLAVD
jgi:hypothetical protein